MYYCNNRRTKCHILFYFLSCLKDSFVLYCVKTKLSFLPLSVHLLHTLSMSVSLSLSQLSNNASSLSPSPHQDATVGRHELLHLFGSFIGWNHPDASVFTPLFFICHFLISTISILSSSLTDSKTGDLTQWLHQAAAAVKATVTEQCWWRGQLTPTLCLGHQGETAERKLLEAIKQSERLISVT